MEKETNLLRKDKLRMKIILKTLFLIFLFTFGSALVWGIIKLFSFFVAGFLDWAVFSVLFSKESITNNSVLLDFMYSSAQLYFEIFCYFIFFIFVSKILSRHRGIEIAKNLFLSIMIIGVLMTITSFIYIRYIDNTVMESTGNSSWLLDVIHLLLDWRHRLLGPNAVYFYDIPSTMKVKSFLFTLLNFYPMLVFLTKYLCSKRYFYLLGALGWWLNSSVVMITNSEAAGWFDSPFFE